MRRATDIIQKTEEQMGESTVSNTGLTSKIQKQLATLLKQKSLKLGPISNFTF